MKNEIHFLIAFYFYFQTCFSYMYIAITHLLARTVAAFIHYKEVTAHPYSPNFLLSFKRGALSHPTHEKAQFSFSFLKRARRLCALAGLIPSDRGQMLHFTERALSVHIDLQSTSSVIALFSVSLQMKRGSGPRPPLACTLTLCVTLNWQSQFTVWRGHANC